MRIRKRQVPLPLSSLSPVPISDPLLNLNRPPPVPVVVQLHCSCDSTPTSRNHAVVNPNENHSSPTAPPHVHDHPQPSDRPADHRPPPIGKVSSINGWEEKKMKKENQGKEDRSELLLLKEEDERKKEEEKRNDIREQNILGAKSVSGFLRESITNSSQVLGRWCEEGEKAFPPKKRSRGMNFEKSSSSSSSDYLNNPKVEKTKANLNKKSCSSSSSISRKNDDNVIDVDCQEAKIINSKKSRGGALMEGSRCSRVNGRGWRCCQQTLVGYSLCEHHLGKGRLRSMTSVRSRSLAKPTPPPPPPPNPNGAPNHEPENNNDHHNKKKRDDDDDQAMREDERDGVKVGDDNNGMEIKMKKPLTMVTNNSKKRMKLGMVKARSISSLLGQTNGAIPMPDLSK